MLACEIRGTGWEFLENGFIPLSERHRRRLRTGKAGPTISWRQQKEENFEPKEPPLGQNTCTVRLSHPEVYPTSGLAVMWVNTFHYYLNHLSFCGEQWKES